MLVWLGFSALLAFAVALVVLLGAVPPAPTFHIFFAAGALPLIWLSRRLRATLGAPHAGTHW